MLLLFWKKPAMETQLLSHHVFVLQCCTSVTSKCINSATERLSSSKAATVNLMTATLPSRSAPVQVRGPAGQLRHVPEGGEEVPVRLVQRGGQVHLEAPLPSHQSLHHPLAQPVQQERQVHQPAHHRGQCRRLSRRPPRPPTRLPRAIISLRVNGLTPERTPLALCVSCWR